MDKALGRGLERDGEESKSGAGELFQPCLGTTIQTSWAIYGPFQRSLDKT